MKSGRIFWAVLFIVIGLLGLVNNLVPIALNWGVIWKFWPVVLVLLGLAALIRNNTSKWIVVGTVGLLAGVITFAAFQRGCDVMDTDWSDTHQSYQKQDLQTSFTPEIQCAELTLNAGAGTFMLSDTTGDLVSASVESSVGKYELTRSDESACARVTLDMADKNVHWRGHMTNRLSVRLHPAPIWDLNFDIGAAKVDFDLSAFRTRHVTLDGGAASITLKLGDKSDTTNITIDTGVSSLLIRVPSSVDCEIDTDAEMSSKQFDGFDSFDSGRYRSDGFGSQAKKMFISIDAGMSSIHVERY